MSRLCLDTIVNEPVFAKLSVAEEFKSRPLGFIDVGARGGAHGLLEPFAKYTAVLGFEPDEEEFSAMLANEQLKQPWADFSLESIALSNMKADAVLHLLSAPTNHSLLPPNSAFTERYNMPKWHEVGTWPLKTELLDTILFNKRKLEPHWGEFIKLDTQGTEYEILLGATRMLTERTVAVVTEVAFTELYRGQKLFSEIEVLLRQYGFTFYGFHSMHTRSLKKLDKAHQRGKERAMYADAVFFKDPLPGSVYQSALSTRSTYVLFVCALLLQYYDFAQELALKTWAKESDEQAASVRDLIVRLSALPYQDTVDDVVSLAEKIKQKPEHANLYAGKFADQRRAFFDYDDVFLV